MSMKRTIIKLEGTFKDDFLEAKHLYNSLAHSVKNIMKIKLKW